MQDPFYCCQLLKKLFPYQCEFFRLYRYFFLTLSLLFILKCSNFVLILSLLRTFILITLPLKMFEGYLEFLLYICSLLYCNFVSWFQNTKLCSEIPDWLSSSWKSHIGKHLIEKAFDLSFIFMFLMQKCSLTFCCGFVCGFYTFNSDSFCFIYRRLGLTNSILNII